MEVRIRKATLDEIDRHAVESYPEECCGVVLSVEGEEQVRRITNIQNRRHSEDPENFPRDARTAYVMDSLELKAVLDESDEQHHPIRLFYHSHPDHRAYFSKKDKEEMAPFGEPSYPDALYLVVSVMKGSVADRIVVSWDPATEEYAPVPLVIE